MYIGLAQGPNADVAILPSEPVAVSLGHQGLGVCLVGVSLGVQGLGVCFAGFGLCAQVPIVVYRGLSWCSVSSVFSGSWCWCSGSKCVL